MTKKKFLNLLESAINGRKRFMIMYTGVNIIRVYSVDDIFTATFIADVIKKTGDAFTGVTVDLAGRPYMLFTY